MSGYLTGVKASPTINSSSVVHAVHSGSAIIIMVIANVYINKYLAKNHSIELTRAEKNVPSKKVFNLRALIISVAIVFASVLVIIFFQNKEQKFPVGAVITSFFLTATNFYFARKKYIYDYFMFNLQRSRINLPWAISARVSPEPYEIPT